MLRRVMNWIAAPGFAVFIFACFAKPALAVNEAAEKLEQEALQLEVQSPWVQRKYSELDELAEAWRSSSARTSSGYWKLSILYNHLDERFVARNPASFPLGADWVEVDNWIAASPDSPTPVILKALMLVRQAFDGITPLRSPGYSVGNLPAKKLDFLNAARELLEKNQRFAKIDPHWHTVLLRILRFQRASDDDLLIAHSEALALHPLYYQTHFEVFRELVKRWHPNLKVLDGFANTILEATKAQEGHMLYARLYADASIELNKGDFFQPSESVWKRMRVGFEQINEKFPTAWNAHHFAFSACMANDRSVTTKLFASFSGPIVREAWQSPMVYSHCKELAGR